MRIGVGSLRAFAFWDQSLDFGIIDRWGEDWKREDIGVLLGLGPINLGLEMVQDGSSIRVLDVLWALGGALKALPSLLEDRDPLEEPSVSYIFVDRDGEVRIESELPRDGVLLGKALEEFTGQISRVITDGPISLELAEIPSEMLVSMYGTDDRLEILRMLRSKCDDSEDDNS